MGVKADAGIDTVAGVDLAGTIASFAGAKKLPV